MLAARGLYCERDNAAACTASGRAAHAPCIACGFGTASGPRPAHGITRDRSSRPEAFPAPECGLVPGWSQRDEARRFDAETLFEYKNGAAEAYFAYGFTRMQGVTCVDAAGVELVIDVSELDDPDHAWGFFVANQDAQSAGGVDRLGTPGAAEERARSRRAATTSRSRPCPTGTIARRSAPSSTPCCRASPARRTCPRPCPASRPRGSSPARCASCPRASSACAS